MTTVGAEPAATSWPRSGRWPYAVSARVRERWAGEVRKFADAGGSDRVPHRACNGESSSGGGEGPNDEAPLDVVQLRNAGVERYGAVATTQAP